jgi:hypothetical protein
MGRVVGYTRIVLELIPIFLSYSLLPPLELRLPLPLSFIPYSIIQKGPFLPERAF